MNQYDLIVDSMIGDIDVILNAANVPKTQFKRGKFIYKIERVEVQK